MHASLSWSASATALAAALAAAFCGVAAKGLEQHSPCTEDAMIVFDASGSMSGNGWGYGSETAGTVSRIDKVRSTLAKILPQVTRSRRVGLITYGPGVWNQCNVHLDLPPTEHAASRIMTVVNALTPAGKTPLTEAVAQAAEVLDFRVKPGLIVVLTDGEETCGGSPCNLGEQLRATAAKLTIHIISLRVKGYTWTGEQSALETKCLAERNGGLYLPVQTQDELMDALEKTLACPMVTRVFREERVSLLDERRAGAAQVLCTTGHSLSETFERNVSQSVNDAFWALSGLQNDRLDSSEVDALLARVSFWR